MRKIQTTSIAAAVAALLAAGQAAQAQDSAGSLPEAATGIEEIVVTAQRREESIQDVPLSVQAFSGETLQEAGVSSVLDLPRLTPNFSAMRGTQTANVRLNIRGVGAASNSAIDPSIGTFIDGVYVPRPGSLFGTMNDISSAEVLRGPQGTLFGRNSTVGAVLLRSADPQDEFEASGELTYGNYNDQKFAGMVNLALGDRFAVRVAGLSESRDGYAHNRYDNKDFATVDNSAVRVGAKWQVTDDVSWTVKYDNSSMGGDGKAEIEIDPDTLTATSRARLTLLTGGNPPDFDDEFDRKSNQRVTGDVDDGQWGLVSNLSWDVGDYTVRYLAGYRTWENEQLESDVLFLSGDFVARTGRFDSKSQSHELQLISPVDELLGGRLDYVAGLYYFQEDYFVGEQFGIGPNLCALLGPQAAACVASANRANATVLDFNQDAENLATYAQANVGLTDTVDLVLGARWTKDDKTGTFVQTVNNPYGTLLRKAETTDLELDDDQFTYRVGLNWTPNDDLLVFGSYSTGYKSGGFNSGGSTAAPLDANQRTFDKETTDNYEVGAKWTLADGAAHLNATAFLMELGDFQDRAFDGNSFNVINAGKIKNQGLELDGDWAAADWLSLYAAVGYLDAKFDEYKNATCLPYPALVDPLCKQDLSGERPAFAPEWQGSTGAEVTGDVGTVGYSLRADLSYMDDMNVNQVNDNNPQGMQEAYTLLSARFSLYFGADQRVALTLWGDNLTDEEYCTGRVAQPFDNVLQVRDPVSGGTVMRCQVNVPRTYGVSFKASF